MSELVHGKLWTYQHKGCRCAPCRGAAAARKKAHYAANRERVLEVNRRWREANLDRHRAALRANYRKNIEWFRTRSREKPARLRAITVGPIVLGELPRGVCGLCGRLLDFTIEWSITSPPPLYPTIDHIQRITDGGLHTQSNLQWAHFICNDKKG